MSNSGLEATLDPPVILVADDDAGVRMLLNVGLPKHGFAVLTAGNGAEAVELFRREHARVDLVLMDVQMPGGDGPEVVRQLRAIDPSARCCLMSGGYGVPAPQELHDLKVGDLLLKPFNWAELTSRLRACLEKPRPDRRRHSRRADHRLAVSVTLLGKGDGSETPAEVLDRSLGGLGLEFAGATPAGERLRVRPASRPSADAVEVEVRYRRPSDGGWLVGCRFASAIDAGQLAAFD